MSTQIALLNTSSPFSQSSAKDSLDVAMILGSYEQQVSLFFMGDGVYQLGQNQSAQLISQKDFIKTFAALEFYDIENIYISKSCLEARGLSEDFVVDNVSVLPKHDFAKTLAQCAITFHF